MNYEYHTIYLLPVASCWQNSLQGQIWESISSRGKRGELINAHVCL
jgi:hypothetical protein